MSVGGTKCECRRSVLTTAIERAADSMRMYCFGLFMTHKRHWMCTAALVLMLGLSPIKVLL
jgi:hypothetical protein